MATYVGFETAGIPGAVVATLGLICPSIIIILLIARVLKQFRESKTVDAVFYGLRPCSIALIAAAGLLVARVTFLNQDALAAGFNPAELLRWKELLLAAVLLVLTRFVQPRGASRSNALCRAAEKAAPRRLYRPLRRRRYPVCLLDTTQGPDRAVISTERKGIRMIDRTIEVERMEHVISVFGSFDQNLRLIETELNVKILDRDNLIHITGEAENVMLAEKAINGLLELAARGENIDAQNVRYILSLVQNGREGEIQKLAGDVICITAKGKPIKPKTIGQREYCEAIANNTVTLGIGPAGTGKTYLAVAAAVAAFRAEKVNRIILTRPAVEAGERLGFLPGDLQSKVDPYLRPLYDALFDMLGPDTYQKYLERGNIEVAPLAYMRGRTLDDSFIILDEAQNTSREQMKMFLTRIGFGSKVVITGDITQIDLPEDKVSGLKVAMRVLEGIDDIAVCTLTGADVVRHRLVQKIIEAYEVYEKRHPAGQAAAQPAKTAGTDRRRNSRNTGRRRNA